MRFSLISLMFLVGCSGHGCASDTSVTDTDVSDTDTDIPVAAPVDTDVHTDVHAATSTTPLEIVVTAPAPVAEVVPASK